MLTSKVIPLSLVRLIADNLSLTVESEYNKLLEQLNTQRVAMLDTQKENAITDEQSTERIQPLPTKCSVKINGGQATTCPPAMAETSSDHVPTTPVGPESATLPATPTSRTTLQSSLPITTSISSSLQQAIAAKSIAPASSQAQGTTVMAPSEPEIPKSEMAMKEELLRILREVYIKYPDAQDDDIVEKMALLLKVSLLAGEQERVKELKRELKAYLIAHHG